MGWRGFCRAGILLTAALVSCAGVASIAQANTYQLSGPIMQRPGKIAGNFDYGYVGPQFKVTPWGTSSDTYVCPSGQSISNWMVVADNADSNSRDWGASSTGSGNQINISVTDWSVTASVYLRLAGTCTTAPLLFPYPPQPGTGLPYPPGGFGAQAYWDSVFSGGSNSPTTAQYAQVMQRAFCWSPNYQGCGVGAQSFEGAQRVRLHNGTNTISLGLKNPSRTRPPAIRLTGGTGCTARRLHLSIQGNSAYVRLKLRCRAQKRGATARVRITRPVRRSFHLHRGNGSTQVQLAKPPGTIKPSLALAYGATNKPCRHVSSRLRLHSRTFDLRVSARCGRAAGNARAHLYIGGLLQ